MRKLQTELLVIGGGSTGTGIARDAAMRGFKTTLVERYDLSEGTTKRYHGLLHSGGRYVVTDPEAAAECVKENRILRHIMPHAISDTGGFFVMTPSDDPDFAEEFLMAAKRVKMPVESIDVSQMLREEPSLNPEITNAFWVSDAVSYATISTGITAKSAEMHGADVRILHEVKNVLREGDKVTGVVCYDHQAGEEIAIHADLVISAVGPMAARVADMADVPVNIVPGKGTMVSVDHIPLKTVVNRCRPPADGDIVVPKGKQAIVGTTDIEIKDPDDFAVTGEEIAQMMAAGEEVLPGFSRAPVIEAWAGVRPLFKDTDSGDNRDISRSYALIDHAKRDNLDGFVTITGGKWTTHRLMAEETVDLVCKKLGVERDCRTHLETLPTLEE